ncbi:RNA-binding protein cabeza-like [Schistocerca nitens]|uniref:RNA-binding protein cabeza-like n=1 Tax=Schistocerca nitens TaxID=7011 RepID=UPI0021191CC2|nr:RNA-binding protein cabeza-like [Schistocerca nitens]
MQDRCCPPPSGVQAPMPSPEDAREADLALSSPTWADDRDDDETMGARVEGGLRTRYYAGGCVRTREPGGGGGGSGDPAAGATRRQGQRTGGGGGGGGGRRGLVDTRGGRRRRRRRRRCQTPGCGSWRERRGGGGGGGGSIALAEWAPQNEGEELSPALEGGGNDATRRWAGGESAEVAVAAPRRPWRGRG